MAGTISEIREALVKVIGDVAEWREYIGTEHPKGRLDPRNLAAAREQRELAEYVRSLADEDPVLIAIAQALGGRDLGLLDDDFGAGADGAMDYSSPHGLLSRYSFGRVENDPRRFLEKYASAVARAAEALQEAP